jgi:hypothetical protein
LTWITGLSSGIALVLSCGDNLSVQANADAAIDIAKTPDAPPTCDCPATEPPLTGRFIVITSTRTLPANGTSANSALCPVDSQPIFGSCTTDQLNPSRNVTLRQAGFFEFSPREWLCFYRNHEGIPVTYRTSAVCLKPPS